MPYSFLGKADYDADSNDPRRMFSNRRGAEPELLETVCKAVAIANLS